MCRYYIIRIQEASRDCISLIFDAFLNINTLWLSPSHFLHVRTYIAIKFKVCVMLPVHLTKLYTDFLLVFFTYH